MTLDEAIKHCEEVAEELRNVDMGELDALYCGDTECIEARKNDCIECAREHKQLAEWLKELRVFKSRKGEWLRMSDLSEQEDDRYQCSHCGNVVHYKDKINLYTFNSWCGRCGSDNGRKIEVEL